MGYQALLFCPDEKTARTVTQVLSELDFTVIPCTEPFAAVKKLMGEHFDAVVVDCDNEQNATLLFKSARNAPNNQSSLAVAVVEGQAGVAKAFRIGANLVLTKPINVEQAKGTLRVARGLLRKSEAAKPASPAATATAKPAPSAPPPPKPALVIPPVSTSRPASPIAPLAAGARAGISSQQPVSQPRVVASASTDIAETGKESVEAQPRETLSPWTPRPEAQASSPKIISDAPRATESATEKIASRKQESPASHSGVGFPAASSSGFGSGAASAPAPAREAKPSVSTKDKPSAVIAEPESQTGKLADLAASHSSVTETSAPAPSFTFGGTVGIGAESASGGNKKTFLAVAAVVLIAAGGYAAWTQLGHSNESTSVPTHVAAQPVAASATVPPTAISSAPVATSSATSPVPSSTRDSASGSQQAGPVRTSSDNQTTASVESAQPRPSKVSGAADSSKLLASSKAPTTKETAEPIVIKNKPARPATAKTATIADAPAPSMAGIAAGGNGGPVPDLMGDQSNAPAPVLQTVNISQGVSQGLVLKKVQPIYPPNALHMQVEGPVQLIATISKTGTISAVKVLSGDKQLARAAVDAVKQWKYKPYLLNDEPVEIQTQITVNFKLPH